MLGSAGTFTLSRQRGGHLHSFQGSASFTQRGHSCTLHHCAADRARRHRHEPGRRHRRSHQAQPPPRPENVRPRRRRHRRRYLVMSAASGSAGLHAAFEFAFESGGPCPVVLWVCDLRCLAPPVSTAASAAVTIWRVRAVTHWWLCPRDPVDRALGAMPSGALGAMLPGALGAVLSVFVALDAVLPVLLARCFRCSAPMLPVPLARPSGACRSWRGAFRCSWRDAFRCLSLLARCLPVLLA
jgi:hypothetical protein